MEKSLDSPQVLVVLVIIVIDIYNLLYLFNSSLARALRINVMLMSCLGTIYDNFETHEVQLYIDIKVQFQVSVFWKKKSWDFSTVKAILDGEKRQK